MAVSFFVFVFLDVLSIGRWAQLKDLEDTDLKRLASHLPSTILQCKAASTTKKYLGGFRRWKQWATDHRISAIPADACQIALYLQHLGESKNSKAAVEEAVNCVSWAHAMAGLSSPTTDPLVRVTLEGLKRACAKPVQKKAPFSIEMLQAIVQDSKNNNSLANIRLATVCVLAFAGFLRYDELANIRPCDLQLSPGCVTVKIPKSKTDQYRQGNEVVIARTGSDTCPVALLEEYLKRGGIDLDSQLFLFRPIAGLKGDKLRNSGSLTYTRLRELLKGKLEELGYSSAEFGVHSLRAGGATAAAASGMPDRLFKKHGRWRSETAKDGYIVDPLAERLRVTKQLGL